MTEAIALGRRLALGTRAQRIRTAGTALACLLGSVVILGTWGLAASLAGPGSEYSRTEMSRLMTITILVVTLPVLVLVAGAARFAAALRDRRFARLRLLGMTDAEVRLVAASEVAVGALAGTVLGALAVQLVSLSGGGFAVAGRHWTFSQLSPGPHGWIVGTLLSPLTAIGAAMLHHGGSAAGALRRSRRAYRPRLVVWRAVPLLAGFAACWWVGRRLGNTDNPSEGQVRLFFAAVGLLGLGVVILVPVVVQLIAALVLWVGHGPASTLLGRRLQSQPSAVTRAVGALMVGLFVVVGASFVVQAFEDTPQYELAAQNIEKGQAVATTTSAKDAAQEVRRLNAVQGVTSVNSFPILLAHVSGGSDPGFGVLVGTCDAVSSGADPIPGCSDGKVNYQVMPGWGPDAPVPATSVTLTASEESHGAGVTLDLADAVRLPIDSLSAVSAGGGQFPIIVPPDAPGVAALAATADRLVIVHAGPGRWLGERVEAAGMSAFIGPEFTSYDFTQGLRSMVTAISVIVLAVGFFAFAAALIDRVSTRRQELTSLRLVGTPVQTLGWVQWWEAALPTAVGSLVAIAGGAFVGATYLRLAQTRPSAGVEHGVIAISVAAILASFVLAGVMVIGTGTRVRPADIRVE